MELKQLVAAAVLFGITAAVVVWWLERFEMDRLHGEVRTYLHRYDEFKAWEEGQRGGS